MTLSPGKGQELEELQVEPDEGGEEAEGGLACSDALNLDGGPSTQLAARAGDFALDVSGAWPVPNAVAFSGK